MTALEALRADIDARIEEMRGTGVFKPERVMTSPQGTHVTDAEGRERSSTATSGSAIRFTNEVLAPFSRRRRTR